VHHAPRSHAATARWRREARPGILRSLAHRTRGLKWSQHLLAVVLDELHSGDDLECLLGNVHHVPIREYASTLALAVALRHSWRPDDLAWLIRKLRLRQQPGRLGRERRKGQVGKAGSHR
jgi:hypothetical protein